MLGRYDDREPMQRPIVAIILGIVMAAGLALFLAVRRGGTIAGPQFWIVVATVGAAAVTAIMLVRARGARGGRDRGAAALAEAAGRLGLTYRAGDREIRDRFRDLPEVRRNAKIRHVLEGRLDGRGLVVLQSSYIVSTGQTIVQVVNSIFAVESPDWPATQVTPRGTLSWLYARLGLSRGLQLENPEFNARFAVRTDDEEFAIALLGPDMQAFMLTKTRVRWRIGHGRVCLVYSGSLKPDRLEASLDRLRGFWSRVPRELEAW
jgi:hypothetical protein